VNEEVGSSSSSSSREITSLENVAIALSFFLTSLARNYEIRYLMRDTTEEKPE